jgi:23S rRNA (guanosine2251-2'-O)-methyltransferase
LTGRGGRAKKLAPGRFAIGGRRPALEAVRSGRAREILVARGSRETPGLREVLAEAGRASVPVRTVIPVEIADLRLGEDQGIATIVSPPPEFDEHHLATRPFGNDALVVVLDGISDPQNFGASARSAEAAGADLLVARERRAAPLTPAAMKASAGALMHLSVARVTNLSRTLELLKDRGFYVAGLDETGEDLWRAPRPPGPLALVVGAEGQGLSRLVREGCDALVAIPLAGHTASLNASAALSVGLFAYARRPDR